ncbi:MAG: cytochrome P450, partial [Hyphomicrobiales bacterium]|nr:cytochrome P450 [Hyphomicrobiales bacterium]
SRLLSDLEDERYFDHVMAETLRLYPLFGVSHRITTAEIRLDEATVLPEGSVLCFNHLKFHTTGYEDGERFDPGRWERLAAREANYIPFGVAANRSCPAQRLAPITMRAAARRTLKHFALYSTASHTRSIPNRGPCLLMRRGYDARWRRMALAWLRLRDGWEDVTRSVVQLVLGSYMVWDARRLRMCQRYFERAASANPDKSRPFSPPGSTAATGVLPR